MKSFLISNYWEVSFCLLVYCNLLANLTCSSDMCSVEGYIQLRVTYCSVQCFLFAVRNTRESMVKCITCSDVQGNQIDGGVVHST